jgi:hypothetical protein
MTRSIQLGSGSASRLVVMNHAPDISTAAKSAFGAVLPLRWAAMSQIDATRKWRVQRSKQRVEILELAIEREVR